MAVMPWRTLPFRFTTNADFYARLNRWLGQGLGRLIRRKEDRGRVVILGSDGNPDNYRPRGY